MFAELLSMFHQSPQGQNAFGALSQQGWSPEQSQQILGAAMPAAANAMHMATQGHPEPAVGLFNIFGGHAGSEFLLGAVAGVLRGDGLFGGVKDGFMGMLGGHIAEVIAQRTGMNPQMAGQVAAALTPFLAHYVHERLTGHPAVQQQFGAPAQGGFTPAFAPQGGQQGFAPQFAQKGFEPQNKQAVAPQQGFGQQGGQFGQQQGGQQGFGSPGGQFAPPQGGFSPQFNPQQGGQPQGGQHHHHHHHHHGGGGDGQNNNS